MPDYRSETRYLTRLQVAGYQWVSSVGSELQLVGQDDPFDSLASGQDVMMNADFAS
jgi:hypothetical protein